MDISCVTRNTYTLFSLLLVLFVTASSSSSFSPTDIVSEELLNKLCSEFSIIRDHSFCVSLLTADIAKKSINIHVLTELTIDKTQEFGLKNQQVLSYFARMLGEDKQLKDAYESCVKSYDIVIKNLEAAKESLRNNFWQQASSAASKALDYASSCKDQFEGPSSEPSFVVDRENTFTRMCHIVTAFTRLFNQIS